MSVHRLNSYEKTLERLFEEISYLDDGDANKAHLTRYLCVRISGYLEVVVKYLIIDLCDGTSPMPISNYVQAKAKYITNLSFKKICELLSDFNSDWEVDFKNAVTEEQRASLNSIVANRNNISHGNQDNTSYRDMVTYYKHIKEVVILLKHIIAKQSKVKTAKKSR